MHLVPPQDRQLVVETVLMAVWQRPDARGSVCIPTAAASLLGRVPQFLAAHHVTCSMSAVDSRADNAAAEGFFGVLKREGVNRRQYRTRAKARVDIFDYIERGHNPRQRRRLAFQQQAAKLLNKVLVETDMASLLKSWPVQIADVIGNSPTR